MPSVPTREAQSEVRSAIADHEIDVADYVVLGNGEDVPAELLAASR